MSSLRSGHLNQRQLNRADSPTALIMRSYLHASGNTRTLACACCFKPLRNSSGMMCLSRFTR